MNSDPQLDIVIAYPDNREGVNVVRRAARTELRMLGVAFDPDDTTDPLIHLLATDEYGRMASEMLVIAQSDGGPLVLILALAGGRESADSATAKLRNRYPELTIETHRIVRPLSVFHCHNEETASD